MGTPENRTLEQNLLEGASFNFRNAVLWSRSMDCLVRGPSEYVQASGTPGRPLEPVFDMILCCVWGTSSVTTSHQTILTCLATGTA
jgi:hypothetical protein